MSQDLLSKQLFSRECQHIVFGQYCVQSTYKINYYIAHLHDLLVIIIILALTLLSPTWLLVVIKNVYTSDSFRPVTFITCTKKSSKHLQYYSVAIFHLAKKLTIKMKTFFTFIGRYYAKKTYCRATYFKISRIARF